MKSKKNAKQGSARRALVPQSNGAPTSLQGYARLIRIPTREDRARAMAAWIRVPFSRCCFSDFRYLVTLDHVEALHKAGVPFEDITDQT